MSIAIVIALLSTGFLLFLILRRARVSILAITAAVAVASWLIVGIGWATDGWRINLRINLPDPKFPAFAIFVTACAILAGRLLGKMRGMQTMALLAGVAWLAVGMGWLAGGWSGILAITVPSLMIVVAGLFSLPSYVLPVKPLPWRWPTAGATFYTFLWLAGLWTGRLEMDVITFWVYFQGVLLFLRFAFPLEDVKGFVPFILFGGYGFITLVIWRIFHGFDLTTLNMLILTQGVLALSCYSLPVKGRINVWALPALIVLFLLGYGVVLFVREIGDVWTNVLIILLGLTAFMRFAIPNEDNVDDPVVYLAAILLARSIPLVMAIIYVLTWGVGLGSGDLTFRISNVLVFGTGLTAILAPWFTRRIKHGEAFKAIITYNLGSNYPYQAVAGRALVTRAKGDPFGQLLAGPGIVLSDADHAIVIYRGISFNRVAPPGLTFTRGFENAKEIVDLRPQLRSTPEVVAKTKDGIEISVVVFTCVQIRTCGEEPELGKPFPYDPLAIRQVVHSQRVAQEKDDKQGWDKLIRQTCERVLRDIIADYTLDELISLEDGSRDPRADIAARLSDGIGAQIQEQDWGLELIAGGIGNINPPEDVIQKRIDTWKAHWESELIIPTETKAELTERRLIEEARASAQKELFRKITEGLDSLAYLKDTDANRLMALSLLEAIERIGVTDPDLGDQDTSQIRMLSGRLA